MARRNFNGGGQGRQQRQAPPADTFVVEGVVDTIHENQYGRTTLYNVELDTGDSVGLGREHYNLQEGDSVRIEAYENDKGYVTAVEGKVEVLEGQAASRGLQAASAPAGGRAPGRDQSARRAGNAPADTKKRSKEEINYLEAVKMAQTSLHFLVNEGIVNLGAKNKTQERETAYFGLLDQFTAQFFTDIDSQAALQRASSAVSGGEDTPEDAGNADSQYDN